MAKHSTLKHNLKVLLKAEPQCAINYTLLVIRYWMRVEGAKDFTDALGCTSPEAITRAFRDLVNAGEVTLPAEVAERRKEQEEQYRQMYGGKRLPGFLDLSGKDL